MRIVDHTPAYTPIPSNRAPRPYARVERAATLPALPRQRRLTVDRMGRERSRFESGNIPPRGWLIDIYV